MGKKKPEEPKLGIFDLVKEDENGFVDMKKFYKENPDIKLRMAEKLKNKQEMIIDSINPNDLISANLRDKAVSSRILGEEVLDIEVGRGGSGVQINLNTIPIYGGLAAKTVEEVKEIEEETK